MARPTTQRTMTPKDRQQKREAVEGSAISVTLAGVTYVVRQGDVCAADVSALRKATGYSFSGLIAASDDDPDIDVFAAIAWLSRRAEGERTLSFEEVARDVTYDDLAFDDDEESAAAEENPPEA